MKIKRSKKYPKLKKGETMAVIRLNRHQSLCVVFDKPAPSERVGNNTDDAGRKMS